MRSGRNAAQRATGCDFYAAKSNTARRVAPERSTGRDWNAAGPGVVVSWAAADPPSASGVIPKPDGRQRPLAIAALEDKIVQRGRPQCYAWPTWTRSVAALSGSHPSSIRQSNSAALSGVGYTALPAPVRQFLAVRQPVANP